MKLIKNNFFLLLISVFCLILLSNCTKQLSKFKLTTNTRIQNVGTFTVHGVNSYFDSDTLLANYDKRTYKINKSKIVQVWSGSSYGNVDLYLKLGSDLTITNNGEELVFSGSSAKENNYLLQLRNLQREERDESFRQKEMYTLNEEAFLPKLEKLHEAANEFIEKMKLDTEIDPRLVTLLDKRQKVTRALNLIRYPRIYQMYTNDTLILSPNYNLLIEEIDLDLNDPDLMTFYSGRGYIADVIQKSVAENPSIPEYYKSWMALIDQKLNNQQTRNYFKYLALEEKLRHAGIDGIEEITLNFLDQCDDQIIKSGLNKLIQKWEHLKKGKSAPTFDGETPTGELVTLENLRGKYVFVDVWATWCGPCKQEIPALKELIKTYEGKNIEFVSISVDRQEDKEKWLNMIDEEKLGGLQLFEEGAFKSELNTKYNIKGIPRFMLIDDQGKIVSAFAPRPSQPLLREMLGELDL